MLRAATEFLPHPVGLENDQDLNQAGYLMLPPTENDWSDDRIPRSGSTREDARAGRGVTVCPGLSGSCRTDSSGQSLIPTL